MNNKILAELLPDLKSFSVWVKTAFHGAVSGGGASILMHFHDPTDFDFSRRGLANLAYVFMGGAVIGIVHLFINPPKPPADGGQQ
jgi:hypothetical protein